MVRLISYSLTFKCWGPLQLSLFFCVWCFNRKKKCLCSWGDLGLTYKRIIKVSWTFPDFSFWGESVSRNSIIMISKWYHYVINLSIFSNFLYQYRQDLWRRENPNSLEFICYDRSLVKDQYRRSILIFGEGPIVADELGGIWVLPSP